MADKLNCSVHGIDASGPAIQQAGVHYKTNNTSFEENYFPFSLPHKRYDFITSIESIEHVEDASSLVAELEKSLKPGGYLVASVPNADILSLEKNPNKFHYRHFSYMDFVKMCTNNDMQLKTFYGQDTYIMSNGFVAGYLPDNMMKMKHRYTRGQFLLFIFKKI
jgi:2-polyprenyl-3-methyl-5-hydroxy-6-metoxy-1,4-benzoquinol methylase